LIIRRQVLAREHGGPPSLGPACADDGRIDHLHGCIMACGQRIHKLVPHAKPAPANKEIEAGGVAAEIVRQIALRRARTQDPKDAVEHAAVIYTRHAARLVRQERRDGATHS
jgi:hypothetical protein